MSKEKIVLSLEDLDGFMADMSGQNNNDNDIYPSIESIIDQTGMKLDSFNDIISFRSNYAKMIIEKKKMCGCGPSNPEESFPDEQSSDKTGKAASKKRNVIVKSSEDKTFNLIIDDERFFTIALAEYFGTFSNIVKDIHDFNLSPDTTLNLYLDISSGQPVNMLFFGPNVVNLLDIVPSRKVYKMNSLCGICELIFAMKCDAIELSPMAAICIDSGINAGYLSMNIAGAYIDFMKDVFEFWKNKGLFTEEEIANVFNSSANVQLYLSAEDIKTRLNLK